MFILNPISVESAGIKGEVQEKKEEKIKETNTFFGSVLGVFVLVSK